MTSSILPKASAQPSSKGARRERAEFKSKGEALTLYRGLLLARCAEEKIRQEYFKDEMKTPVHLGVGQEAIPVGVCHCLPPGARTFGTYRNHALYLTVTGDSDGFFGELYGKANGSSKGKAGSMHLSAPERGLMATSAVVGTTIPLAVGAALASAYRGSSDLVVVFFGDGAMEEGVFWESLNFACLKKLRVLFICEDNDLAIHTASSERRGFRTPEEVVRGFDCHVAQGDGSDLMEVIRLTRQLLRQVGEQPRPAFLRLTYFRFLEHVGPSEDFDAGYRRRPTPEEAEHWDPLIRFERTLRQNGCSVEEMGVVRETVMEQLARSVLAAQQAPFAPLSELETDTFA